MTAKKTDNTKEVKPKAAVDPVTANNLTAADLAKSDTPSRDVLQNSTASGRDTAHLGAAVAPKVEDTTHPNQFRDIPELLPVTDPGVTHADTFKQLLPAPVLPVDPNAPEQEVLTEDAVHTMATDVAKKSGGAKNTVTFVASVGENFGPISAGGKEFTPTRDATGKYLVYSVDNENADAFEQHSFVKSGRIVRGGK